MCSVAATQVTASNEEEGFAGAIERTSSSPEVAAVLPVRGASSTVGVADPRVVPQPK